MVWELLWSPLNPGETKFECIDGSAELPGYCKVVEKLEVWTMTDFGYWEVPFYLWERSNS